jgi:Pyruvate/2-oxoacid:ferredoxin oxidoreductase gamma subunit
MLPFTQSALAAIGQEAARDAWAAGMTVHRPGGAVVEILELCTAYATRWNPLTGAKLREVAEAAGDALGVLHDELRPSFASAYEEQRPAAAVPAAAAQADRFEHHLERPIGLVLAGTAGERIQTAANILARAGLACGLYATQKNDNPVTQGTGFSVSEVILSPEPILYTGIEQPDAVLVASADGLAELERNGVVAAIGPETQVIVDEELELPPLPVEPLRRPLRANGGKRAALAAVAAWAETRWVASSIERSTSRLVPASISARPASAARRFSSIWR